MNQNTEMMIISQIDRSADGLMKQIIVQLNSKKQCNRLSDFLKEFLQYIIVQDQKHANAGIELLNNTIAYFDKDRPKVRGFDQSQVKLDKFIIEQKVELLVIYFEKALIFGCFEGSQLLQYNNYKMCAEKYAQNQQNKDRNCVQEIIRKMDESFQERQQGQDFEVPFFEKLNEAEIECVDKIITLSQQIAQVASSKTQSKLDRWYQELSNDKKQMIQEKGQGNPVRYRQVVLKEYINQIKIDQKARDLIQEIKYINTLDKLQSILDQYKNFEVLKKKNKVQGVIDLIKTLKTEEQQFIQYQQQQLQLQPQQQQRHRQQQEMNLEKFKYFYKYYKVRNVNGEQKKISEYVSLRNQFAEFFKQINANFDLPKKNKGQIQQSSKNFNQNYQYIYHCVIEATDDQKKIFEFLLQVQEFMLKYFKFRFLYLVLIYQIVVELDLSEAELQKAINIVLHEMIKKTTKDEIYQKDYSFTYITSKFKQLSGHEIIPIISPLGENYQNLSTLEITLKHVTNKLLQIIISCQQGQIPDKLKAQSIQDIQCFEVCLLNECNSSSKQTTSKFVDQLHSESEDKDNKKKFFQSIQVYHSKVLQIMSMNCPADDREKGLRSQKSNNYKKSIEMLRQDYFTSNPPITNKEIFDKEMQINEQYRIVLEHEAQNINDQNVADILIKIKDAFFKKDTNQIIYNNYLIKSLSFFLVKTKSELLYNSIERKRYMFLIGGEKYGLKMMDQIGKSNQELLIRQLPLSEQYKFAVNAYNTALEIIKKQVRSDNQQFSNFQKLSDQFPKTSTDLKSFNTTEFNFCCYIILKITGNVSQQSSIKYKSAMTEDELCAEISKIQDAFRATESGHEELIIKELQTYKSELIKEANELLQKSGGSNKFYEKLLDIFSRQYYYVRIMEDVIKLKEDLKKDGIPIELSKKEQFQKAQQFWQDKTRIETQFLDEKEKQKLRSFVNEIFRISSDIQDLIQKMNEKQKQNQTELSIRKFVDKNWEEFIQSLNIVEKDNNKPPIPLDNIKLKLKQLRNEKFKEINEVFDQQVLFEIGFQFDYFIKNLLGQVLQVSLTQKKGDEFKVFQNKQDNQTQQNTKYKQLKDMYTKYGHQKDSTISIVLQTSQEPKPLLSYSLCDMTPLNRYQEFMKLKYDLEPIQDDIIKNKIRRSKWKDEHPQLEDILQKKIKRGTELWSQVQEFLLKRDRPALPAESSDEDDKPIRQESDVDTVDPQDELHRKVNEAFVQQKQSNERNVPTQLKNVEKDIPYLVQKDITTRMVQHVLESIPYYKKSKILLRSYLFS